MHILILSQESPRKWTSHRPNAPRGHSLSVLETANYGESRLRFDVNGSYSTELFSHYGFRGPHSSVPKPSRLALLILLATILVPFISFGWGPYNHQLLLDWRIVHLSARAQSLLGAKGEYISVFSYNQNRHEALADSLIVQVIVRYSDSRGVQHAIPLFDDGDHGDSSSGDRIFSNFVEGTIGELTTLRNRESVTFIAELRTVSIYYRANLTGFAPLEHPPIILWPADRSVTEGCVSLVVDVDNTFVLRDVAAFRPLSNFALLDRPSLLSAVLFPSNGSDISSTELCGGLPTEGACTLVICCQKGWSTDGSGPTPILYIDAIMTQRSATPQANVHTPLFQNHPNPFSDRTYLAWRQTTEGMTSLRIIDINGREVIRLINSEWVTAGLHYTTWNGSDAQGLRCAAGIYLAVMYSQYSMLARRLVLLP